MFYIFHGDDTYSQRETLTELLARIGDPSLLELNTTRLPATASFGELREVADVIPFLAPARLVIVEDMLSSNGGRELVDHLLAYLPHLPETTRLIFLESQALRSNHRLLRLAEESEHGYVRQFSRPEGVALSRWIEERLERHGGTATPQAIYSLATNIGNDLALLENEIEKLVLYRAGEKVEAEDVALLCPHVAEASIFELVDALGNRNGERAATLLSQKLAEGADPFYLFAMIVRQFRLLVQIRELSEEGLRPPAIAQRLRIHSFVAGKLHQQCQRFSLAQIERIYAHLLDIDVGVKTGRAEMTTALNLFVASLAF
jgi:DNA polymerase III subunit delta